MQYATDTLITPLDLAEPEKIVGEIFLEKDRFLLSNGVGGTVNASLSYMLTIVFGLSALAYSGWVSVKLEN